MYNEHNVIGFLDITFMNQQTFKVEFLSIDAIGKHKISIVRPQDILINYTNDLRITRSFLHSLNKGPRDTKIVSVGRGRTPRQQIQSVISKKLYLVD